MAVGFTPKHVEDFPLNDLTQQLFLVLANETVKKIGWKVNYQSVNGLICFTNNGMFFWNAEIKIKIENGVANITSASTGNDVIDWGKNKKNVTNFKATFQKLKKNLTKEVLNEKYHIPF